MPLQISSYRYTQNSEETWPYLKNPYEPASLNKNKSIPWGGFCYEENKYFQYAADNTQYKTTQLPYDLANSTMLGNDRSGALQWQGKYIFMTEIIAFERDSIQGEQRETWFS